LELIYHYTSIGALKGILNKDHAIMRVTDSRYLNDTREILRGIERATHEISQRLNTTKYKEPIPNAIEFMERIIGLIESSLFFTTSFCKQGDKLSQWFAYCPANGGYAIGFDREALTKLANEKMFEVHDVNYKDEPYKFITSASQIEKRIDAVKNRTERDRSLYELAPIAAKEIAITKDFKFHSESEVRLFSKKPKSGEPPEGLEFFEKNSILVPYLPFEIPKNAVKKVIIGPMQHKELAYSSLQMFKKVNGYEFDIEFSTVPLRQF